MPTRRHLFLDPDLTAAPTDAAGKSDGYSRMAKDGTLYVVINGAYVAASGPGAGGGGGTGDTLFLVDATPLGDQGTEGGYAIAFITGQGVQVFGPKNATDYPTDPWTGGGREPKWIGRATTASYKVTADAVIGALDPLTAIYECVNGQDITLSLTNDYSTQSIDGLSRSTFQVDKLGLGFVNIVPEQGVTINGFTGGISLQNTYTSVILRRYQDSSDHWYALGDFVAL